MKAQVHYGLDGAFKVDLYSGKRLMESTDWFNNFITHTGLSYPSIFAFADCFRFLSIGSGGNTANFGVSPSFPPPGTTGLTNPIYNYAVNGANQPTQQGTWLGWQGYEVGAGALDSPCGTTLTDQGLSLFRAWSIPTGDIAITVGDQFGLQISEFMVSPQSGNDPSGCWAFSRVTRNVSIPFGWRAVVTYQLRIKVAASGTGINVSRLTGGSFQTGNADVTNDISLVSGWNQLSGYYRQVYPGLACIDSNGATYVPRFGAIMEPSIVDLSNFGFYLSPDNAAFDVNALNGGGQNLESAAYASDGLMASYYFHTVPLTWQGQDTSTMSPSDKDGYYYQPLAARTVQAFPDASLATVPLNIRLGMQGQNLSTPNVSNYSLPITADVGQSFDYQETQDASTHAISWATPGYFGIDNTRINFHQKAVFSTRIYKLPFYNGYQYTGRAKKQTRRTMFAPVAAMGTNSRFGSLVAAYVPDGELPQLVFYPMIDTLFFDSSGRATMRHYRTITGLFMTQRGSGVSDGYFTIYQQGAGPNTPSSNIQRYVTGRLQMGGIDINGNMVDTVNFSASFPFLVFTGNNSYNTFQNGAFGHNADTNTSIAGGSSGFGAVLGFTNIGVNNLSPVPDTALIDHSITNPSSLQTPALSAPVYWPDVGNSNNQIIFQISGLKFTSGAVTITDIPSLWTPAQLANSGFCRPTGFVYHVEHFGSSGFRLLPNHGCANNTGQDVYPQVSGGYYPGLSLDNGLDLYLDIQWSAPCGSAVGCQPTGNTIVWN